MAGVRMENTLRLVLSFITVCTGMFIVLYCLGCMCKETFYFAYLLKTMQSLELNHLLDKAVNKHLIESLHAAKFALYGNIQGAGQTS